MKRVLAACCLLYLTFTASGAPTADAADSGITVFAAASLTNVLQELGDGFTRKTQIPVRFSFAASSALARQIENGAPADAFFSADIEWMDYLQKRNLILADSRHDVVGNRLVLIAPTDSAVKIKIEPGFKLAAAIGDGRLATGDPDSVPVGRYAQQALSHLGVWSEISPRTVRADSVRSALAFVDRGEAALGIVYQTDALIDKKVRIVDVFPQDSHAPIVYPLALTAAGRPDSARANAARFSSFVRGPAGDAAFKTYGFQPLH